jgi:hypothetical protein
MNKNKTKHIILDIDGTLIRQIENHDNYQITGRPHLKEFIDYCFATFGTVSIWTAATKEWYNEVYEKVLKHVIPTDCNFHFVYTRKHITQQQSQSNYFSDFSTPVVIKPLSKVWKKFEETHTQHNTIILDDTPTTFMWNTKNAIHIKTYSESDEDQDDDLKLVMGLLEKIKNDESVLESNKSLYI